MAISVVADTTAQPSERELAEMLGRTSALWNDLKNALQAAHGPLVEEWKPSAQARGWSLRLKQKARTLVYMAPCRGHFFASFALGEKACRAARDAGIDPAVLAVIDAAPKFPEGRGVRMKVRRTQDVRAVRQLVAFKAAR